MILVRQDHSTCGEPTATPLPPVAARLALDLAPGASGRLLANLSSVPHSTLAATALTLSALEVTLPTLRSTQPQRRALDVARLLPNRVVVAHLRLSSAANAHRVP